MKDPSSFPSLFDNETLQGVWNQPRRWLFADADPNSNFLWSFHDVAASRGIARREFFVDQGSLPARYRGTYSNAGVAGQCSSAHYGGNEFLDDAPDPEKRRSHATAHDDVHAHHLYRLLL